MGTTFYDAARVLHYPVLRKKGRGAEHVGEGYGGRVGTEAVAVLFDVPRERGGCRYDCDIYSTDGAGQCL